MAFVKISEQPSLYNDLEKKSVREILEDINTEDQKVALCWMHQKFLQHSVCLLHSSSD